MNQMTHKGLLRVGGLSRSNSSSFSESSEDDEDKSSRLMSSCWKGSAGEKTAGVQGALKTECWPSEVDGE